MQSALTITGDRPTYTGRGRAESMEEALGRSGVSVTNDLVAEVVAQQLESMLSVGNYDGVKLLLALSLIHI